MRHAIIGCGNLGLDLQHELKRQLNVDASMFGRAVGFDASPATIARVFSERFFDTIWVPCSIPVSISVLRRAPAETRIVLFSTDSCADERAPNRPDRFNKQPRHDEDDLRTQVEQSILAYGRPLTTIVRVGSLYGWHRPTATVPGVVLSLALSDKRIRLPQNLVTPTPTLWAAAMVVRYLDSMMIHATTIHHCAPTGNVPVWDWAALILQGIADPQTLDRAQYIDETRPSLTALGCSFTPTNWHWHDVWATYFKASLFTPRELIAKLPRGIAFPGARETLA